MARSARCLLLAISVCISPVGRGQQPASSQPPRDVPAGTASAKPAETLHASTQLVIVDVVVEDSSGHAIHGLTRDNFVLTEQKKLQKIRNFEEHSATSDQKPGPP